MQIFQQEKMRTVLYVSRSVMKCFLHAVTNYLTPTSILTIKFHFVRQIQWCVLEQMMWCKALEVFANIWVSKYSPHMRQSRVRFKRVSMTSLLRSQVVRKTNICALTGFPSRLQNWVPSRKLLKKEVIVTRIIGGMLETLHTYIKHKAFVVYPYLFVT